MNRIHAGFPAFKEFRSTNAENGTRCVPYGNEAIIPLMPRQAPEGLSGFARRGVAGRPRVFRRAEKPVRKNLDKSEKRRIQRYMGVFSFGYFSLDKHKFAGANLNSR